MILQSSEYQDNVTKIDAFFKDENAQASYREFAQLGEELHKKQHDGALEQSDIEGYESKLAALKADPITGAFMGAEENLNSIVQQVSKTVGKTLELGRLPEPEDLEESGCCSSGGCGCD